MREPWQDHDGFFILQREFDENEVDPYHGKREEAAETDAMELPEDLNLDREDEQAGDEPEGDGEGRSQGEEDM